MRRKQFHSKRFDRAMTHTFKWEGGYVNDPHDPGGETKYGISKRSNPEIDIPSLTKKDAKEIYYKKYWFPFRFDELSSETLAIKVFDVGVNVGTKKAIKWLQKCVGATVDGIIGPETIRLTNQAPQAQVLEDFLSMAEDYYRALKSFSVFGRGWLNRLEDLP